MSSGEVKNHQLVLPIHETSSPIYFTHNENENQINKYNFISVLISLLFNKSNSEEEYKKISSLMNIILTIPSSNFKDLDNSEIRKNIYDNENDYFMLESHNQSIYNKNQILIILNKIRLLFDRSSYLSSKEKFDFCSIERFFMKKYLQICVQ